MSLSSFPESWHFIVELPEEISDQVFEYNWDAAFEDDIVMSGEHYCPLEPVTFNVKISRTGLGIDMGVQLQTTLGVECVRCLSSFKLAIDEDFRYCYMLQPGVNETESDYSDPGDSVVITVDRFEKVMDVTEKLWECFVISLPRYPECPDGCDLSGPISTKEEDEAADPRFQFLADNIGSFLNEGGNPDGSTKE